MQLQVLTAYDMQRDKADHAAINGKVADSCGSKQ